jgi:indolepyruvate ferredoxin oxidoreductase
MELVQVALDDKYELPSGRLYLNGTQALVRLLLTQRSRDTAAGLHTGGFVSGYRGSPLGGLDRELWRAEAALRRNDITFWPGINEDLAATAVWGTQMVGLDAKAKVDGVFGLWYGKGAGLDRCGDVMRHAHGAGTARHGGVLAVVGDDHAQKSSTHPYHSEPTFADLLMPVLYPADVGEILTYGLLGWSMSRFSGAWVGLKTMAETLDCSTSLVIDAHEPRIRFPEGGAPTTGVHFRWPDPWDAQEPRLVHHKLEAAKAFARANAVDRVVLDSHNPRLGILTAGKSYSDLRQALADLGVSNEQAADLGLRVCKVGMPWPLDSSQLLAFADGLGEILVIEEKRPLIEAQAKQILYDLPHRPRITGKKDEGGRWQFPWVGECTPDLIARVLLERLARFGLPDDLRRRSTAPATDSKRLSAASIPVRQPYFCSGCPHNRSTTVPDGSRAIAGVGCHYMAVAMDRQTSTFSHMGGEGATWIGQAPFTDTDHVFVNLGEGTYFHSGSLAVRACIAAGVNITYKLLFNDAVAMTGGQPVDGRLTVPQLSHQLRAEGISVIRVVAEDPDRYSGVALAPGTTVQPREALDAVQRELRAVKGVSALIFDQTCAAEKRRRRKRKQMADPQRHVVINELVCEGCGDCSKQSNCLSVVPLDTEFGRKRAIDHSSCNKDFSCLEGFCPSFVTVEGGERRRKPIANLPDLPEPRLPSLDKPYNIFVTGVGGTGIVTIGALVGMAAHLEGRSCTVLDQLGMAQKGGAVVSHIRLAPSVQMLPSPRVPTEAADLLLGCDLLVTGQSQTIGKIAPNATTVVLNTHETITGAFSRDPDLVQPITALVDSLTAIAGRDRTHAFDATDLAVQLAGDSVAANLLLLGYAFQLGAIPVSARAIVRAIELNGVAVAANIAVFNHGRKLAVDRARAAAVPGVGRQHDAGGIGDAVRKRVEFLSAYQDQAYADRYAEAVTAIADAERAISGHDELAEAAAHALFKLMAYKDEYEVARLHVESGFLQRVRGEFAGRYRLHFHLAPPIMARRDAVLGRPRKRTFGPWVLVLLRVLATLKFLRGTPFDLFGYTAERRQERRLIDDYLTLLRHLSARLSAENHAVAVELAALPLRMRGFGPVKEANVKVALERQVELLRRFDKLCAQPDGAPKQQPACDPSPTAA